VTNIAIFADYSRIYMEHFKVSNKLGSKTSNTIFFLSDLKAKNNLESYQAKTVKDNTDKSFFTFTDGLGTVVVIKANENFEKCRKSGNEFFSFASKQGSMEWNVQRTATDEHTLAFLEGVGLSSYAFEKYKTEKKAKTVELHVEGLKKADLEELRTIVSATCVARTMVNEPHSYLNASQYTKEIKAFAKTYGFKLKVWDKEKIIKEKMGGILGVNKGSIQEPTFNILEYKSPKAVNSQPIVLVGKGVMYDTGGLSLKPTANSMDMMKSDMGGSASVVGAFCAVAGQKLPIHIIGLIPATDNRPGLDAIVPGDVLTMYSGKTVEVLNTDAEGRLVLADALHYAKRLKPELVMDFATLTGAAARAVGPQGVACMGNASEDVKTKLKESGANVHERLLEFPMWEEYEPMLKSEIADINNLGGAVAGQTTAGMFLQHFVDYPWMHFDIAGAAFLKSPDSYRGKNGTGVGVRLLYNFLKNRSKK
jgi:leucyl aminopeptidase